jgi:hypothetical protein
MKPRHITATVAAVAAFIGAGLVVTNNYACGCAPPKPESQTLPGVNTSSAPIPGDVIHADPGTWVTAGDLAAYPNTNYAYRWVRCDTSGGGCTTPAGTPNTCTETATDPLGCEYTINAGDTGSTMRVEVTATNAGGTTPILSLPTPTVGGGPPPPPPGKPSAPTNFTATPGDQTIDLAWGASTCTGCTVAGYHLYRGGTLIASPATTSYHDTGLTNGTVYSYVVKAVDSNGAEGDASQTVNAVPQATPPPPTGAKVRAAPDCTCDAPSGGWRVEYADAFGAPLYYFNQSSTSDNTIWPNRFTGDTGNDQPYNGGQAPRAEMQEFNPSKVSISSQGLVLTCTRTGSGTTPFHQFLCGDATTGANHSNGSFSTPAGYRMFRWVPYQSGATFVIEAVTRWPINTGEADPGFWSVGGNWNDGWEIDFPEMWGYQKISNNWCDDQMAWPGHLVLGAVTGGHDVSICTANALGYNPAPGAESSNPFHTIDIEMLPGGAYRMYSDGKRTWTGTHSQNSLLGDIIASFSLRDGPDSHCNWGNVGGGCSPNDTNWPTGTSRTWVFRSIAVYENASANNSNTAGGAPMIAQGTCVIGQNGC